MSRKQCVVCPQYFRPKTGKRYCSLRCALLSGVVEAEPDACWVWSKYTNKQGYGQLTFHATQHFVHRVAWELHNGPVPEGLYVLHHCDNPPCCNPSHLWLGTLRDNNYDCKSKGRRVDTHGSDRYNAKLTEQFVRQIRVSSYSERALAKKYHVGRITIRSVKGRLRWAHVV